MITISLCMIVKNEEENIKKCLNSVSNLVDEIIIVDTGSTDNTKTLCEGYTTKIYDYKWIDDFSAARNYSYSYATMDYILWLDADDIILPEDSLKLIELKKKLSDTVDVVMMKYNTGVDIKGDSVLSYYRERLTKRCRGFQWREPVHEYLKIYGNVIEEDIYITHGKPPTNKPSDRNIKIYEKMLLSGKQLTPRGSYYYARELKEHERFIEAINQFELFLDENLGWREDNIAACSELAKCYLSIKQYHKALEVLYRSFVYDLPRAEICCQIGYHYQEKGDYEQAIFWFQFILTLKMPTNTWGFIRRDCWDYVPLLECAVCYDRLGDYEKAEKFNELALKIKPYSESCLNNQAYFISLKSSNNERK